MARVAGLDRARIVAASLDLADTEGLDKLSMRRLSAKLGVTPMAIYHHVAGKEQLLDLVIDESLGGLAPLDDQVEPREALIGWFFAFHELLIAHPALAQAVAGRRLEGPAATHVASGALRLAERSGLDEEAAVELLLSLFSFTIGGSLYRVSRESAGARFGARRILDGDGTEPVAERRRRERLARANVGDEQFRGGLCHLVDGYLAGQSG